MRGDHVKEHLPIDEGEESNPYQSPPSTTVRPHCARIVIHNDRWSYILTAFWLGSLLGMVSVEVCITYLFWSRPNFILPKGDPRWELVFVLESVGMPTAIVIGVFSSLVVLSKCRFRARSVHFVIAAVGICAISFHAVPSTTRVSTVNLSRPMHDIMPICLLYGYAIMCPITVIVSRNRRARYKTTEQGFDRPNPESK